MSLFTLDIIATTTPYFTLPISGEFIAVGVYFIAGAVALLLREFTHGWVKYTLAALFAASLATLCYVALLEEPPMNYIAVGIALFGVTSGLWHWVRIVVRELRGER